MVLFKYVDYQASRGSVWWLSRVLYINHKTLKPFSLVILSTIILSGCVSDRPWYDKTERVNVSSKASNYFAPSESEPDFAMDSTLFDLLIDKGSSEFCAMVSAFAMSDVELERQLPNRCHSQYFSFQNCEASMLEDTLTLVFKTQNPRRSIASNKLIKIKILGNDHYSEIIHWGEDYREVTKIDGSIELKKSPTSEVLNSRLKLNKRNYELGDTIIGEIKLASYQVKGKRKTKIKEFTEGKFRAIISGSGIECGQDKSLATSWLK